MDLEELKKAWQSQSARLDKLEAQNLELKLSLRRNKITTNRSKLMNTYRALMIIAFVMVPVVFISFSKLGIADWLTFVYAATLLLLGFANTYVYLLIQKIRPGELSLRETLRTVLELEKTRHNIRVVSIFVVIIVMVLLLYSLCDNGDYAPAIGGLTGGIIGMIIGLRKEAHIKAMIRSIKEDLRDALRDD